MNTTYSYTVSAYDAASNNSAQSSPAVTAKTPDQTAPSVPTGVGATAQSETSIQVTWTASTDNVGVTGYKVYRNGSQVGTSATTSYTNTGLSPWTIYSYTVSAYDAASNNSAQSSPAVTAKTPDNTAPSVPTGVTATAQSSSSISVSWTASTDNVGVTGYKVYRNGSQVGTSATTSYTDTGLSASTTYSYTVSAYDAASNNSAQSSPAATATTQSGAPHTFMEDNFDSGGYSNWYIYKSDCSTTKDGYGSSGEDGCSRSPAGYTYRGPITNGGDRCYIWKSSFNTSGYTDVKLKFSYKTYDSSSYINAYVMESGNWVQKGGNYTSTSWANAEISLTNAITNVRFALVIGTSSSRWVRLDCVSVTGQQ
jgi:chitodextrinase